MPFGGRASSRGLRPTAFAGNNFFRTYIPIAVVTGCLGNGASAHQTADSKAPECGSKIALQLVIAVWGCMKKEQIARLIFGVVIASLAFSISAGATSQTAFDGTISAGGINFDATLIVNNTGFNTTTLTCTVANCSYSLAFTGMNGNSSAATLNAFALQLFGNGSNASFDLSGGYAIPSGWIAVAGAKINNGNPGLGCNPGTGVAGWLCGSATGMGNVLQIGAGQKFTMNFAGNFQQGTSILSQFDLMSHGLTNTNDSHSKWSVSQGFDWNQYTPIPEPETWTVLGSGLCSMVWMLRKRFDPLKR